jgi:hypothetical protein
MDDGYVFEYNDKNTYGSNFLRWRARNNEEKMLYKEKEHSLGEAKKIFDEMYSHKKDIVVSENWREGTIWQKN